MRFGIAGIGAALFTLGSVASSQGTSAGPTSLFQPQPLHVRTAQVGAGSSPQVGFESTVAPALVVQPGPPPVPLGKPQLRHPEPQGDSRPELPDYDSDTDAANLRIGPSVEQPIDGKQDTPSERAGNRPERQP